MKINDTTGEQGICQDTRFLLGMDVNDTVSYSTNNIIRNVNSWYRKTNSKIWKTSIMWEFDDENYTDLPIATTNLVDSQQDYELPSAAQKVMKLEVKDSSGNFQVVLPIDKTQIRGVALTEFYEEDGMPAYYDMIGRSIFLYPAPGDSYVTTTAGLKLYFSRDIDEFATTDTSTEPGFAEDFHRILSLGAALDYAMANEETSKIPFLREQLADMFVDLEDFYGRRHIDHKIRMIPRKRSPI